MNPPPVAFDWAQLFKDVGGALIAVGMVAATFTALATVLDTPLALVGTSLFAGVVAWIAGDMLANPEEYE